MGLTINRNWLDNGGSQLDTAYGLIYMSLSIRRIAIKNLVEFASKADAQTPIDGVLPITLQRALAHSRNPVAISEDISLLVAYADEECVGYIGLLPGHMRVQDRTVKVYWLSTWYVRPNMRRTMLGIQLLNSALGLSYDLLTTGISKSAQRAYVGFRFKEFGPLRYCHYWLFRRPMSRLVRGVLRRGGLNWAEKWVASKTKHLFFRCVLPRLCEGMAEVDVRIVERIDSAFATVGAFGTQNSTFVRDLKIINWMLEYPWVTESETGRDQRYEFSSRRPLFRYVALEIRRRTTGAPSGFLVMSVTSKDCVVQLAVLDWSFACEADCKLLPGIILNQAARFGADLLLLPPALANLLPRPPCKIGTIREESRIYYSQPFGKTGPLGELNKNPCLSYCDGDIAFT